MLVTPHVSVRGLLVLALAVVSMGCAGLPTGRFDALVGASQQVEATTADVDVEVVQLTRRFMIHAPAPGRYSVDSFRPEIDVAGQRLDFDFGPRLEPRHAALEAIVAYTEALAAFAKKDYQSGLDRSTQSLGGSLNRLGKQLKVSDQVQRGAGLLATAINGLGRVATDRLRKAELDKAMATASPGLDVIASYVGEINDQAKRAVVVMRDDILRRANGMAVADGVARIELNERVEAIIVASKVVIEKLDGSTRAVAAIRPAHDELRNSLDDEAKTLDRLASLVAEAKRLQKSYSSLK